MLEDQDQNSGQVANEPSAVYQSMSDRIVMSFDDLRRMIDSLNLTQSLKTMLGRYLLGNSLVQPVERTALDKSVFSPELQRLIGCVELPETDETDDRLAYILSK